MRVRILRGRDEDEFFDTAERVGPYLTLTRGIAYERENIAWAQLAIRVLERRRRLRDTSADDAAPAFGGTREHQR
ncbi:putative PadR family transcriptional regulator [Gordonia rhizosphera NBRC 16068]|uniref:Putative PadR family transcriptional regulator n=1 Tax=Gordonia rhizosphera NBRC 16068 TaxID=1108045 RepID=K6WXR9_9ACTN|nr:putative PadR family transcriptional regulator [Gordonia rhizosphera NBRC 16068]